MIKAIFFDFNGVIIDDERLQMAAYQEVLREHGIELTEDDYFSSLGMDDKTFVRAAFSRANKKLTEEVLQKTLDEKTARHRKLIENNLPLFPGVVNFLKATARHYDLGLVSMSNSAEVGYVLDLADLRPLFSVIVTAEDVNVCKPAPDCYRSGFEKLNENRLVRRLLPVLANECLVIEDSPPGVESGRAAGMRTLGVTSTVSEAALRGAGAEIVTPSLFDWTVDAVHHVFD
ncbi:MAG TPA: HAD family phosphatase [Pyrinomonadaceae bacterium]|nr:HAD family phosphatase [Pyrinomonadaceae bacterium]